MKRITKKDILKLKKEYDKAWDHFTECKKSGDEESINRALKRISFIEATINYYMNHEGDRI